jgi:hypothetical protein
MLIWHCSQLQRIVRAYAAYYNHARPHQGIEQRLPDRSHQAYPRATGSIIARPVLNGLHHDYARAAYLH